MQVNLIGLFQIVQEQKNRVEVQGNNLHFVLFKTKEMQIIPLNLDSVLLFLHNSKLAYYIITSELVNQGTPKALFTFALYTSKLINVVCALYH